MKVYLAIPYTRHEDVSFPMANHAASEIIKMGHIPFSPISMSHPIVVESKNQGNFERELLGTWDIWSRIDMSFIDWCDEVWVVNLDEAAVKESTGVQAEIEYAKKQGKEVKTIEVEYNKPYRSAAVAMRSGANRDVVDALDEDVNTLTWKFKFPSSYKETNANAKILAKKIINGIKDCPSDYDAFEVIEKILSV